VEGADLAQLASVMRSGRELARLAFEAGHHLEGVGDALRRKLGRDRAAIRQQVDQPSAASIRIASRSGVRETCSCSARRAR
jgi:hypothetical protein